MKKKIYFRDSQIQSRGFLKIEIKELREVRDRGGGEGGREKGKKRNRAGEGGSTHFRTSRGFSEKLTSGLLYSGYLDHMLLALRFYL